MLMLARFIIWHQSRVRKSTRFLSLSQLDIEKKERKKKKYQLFVQVDVQYSIAIRRNKTLFQYSFYLSDP